MTAGRLRGVQPGELEAVCDPLATVTVGGGSPFRLHPVRKHRELRSRSAIDRFNREALAVASGDDFMYQWENQPLARIVERIQAGMPFDRPGTLSLGETVSLVTYLLRRMMFRPARWNYRRTCRRFNG